MVRISSQARRVWLLLLLAALLGGAWPAAAQPKVNGRFGEYWREHGGLSIFGYAISEAAIEINGDTKRELLTQWFERNRFEMHPENARPYDVLLGRLGADRLQQLGRNWHHFPKAPSNTAHYFPETGHAIAHEPFWRYWSSHGLEFDGRRGTSFHESLALFGMPLSEPLMETNTSGDRVLTQWFERARFEDHGTKGVLLGLLGNEISQRMPEQPTTQLQYLWPVYMPPELSVMPEGSFVNETMWLLHLAQPHARQPDITIGGGVEGGAPGRKLREVTVRGQSGTVFATSSGHAIVWSERGRVYTVLGNRSANVLLQVAENLELLDRATWQRRLQGDTPASQLKYLWPRFELELPLSVWPGGRSFANERSFALHLAWPHATEPDVTISGGVTAVPPEGNGTSVMVRGQRATLYNLGKHRAIAWTEDDQFYLIFGTLAQRELLALANNLEALDLQTFRNRLAVE